MFLDPRKGCACPGSAPACVTWKSSCLLIWLVCEWSRPSFLCYYCCFEPHGLGSTCCGCHEQGSWLDFTSSSRERAGRHTLAADGYVIQTVLPWFQSYLHRASCGPRSFWTSVVKFSVFVGLAAGNQALVLSSATRFFRVRFGL